MRVKLRSEHRDMSLVVPPLSAAPVAACASENLALWITQKERAEWHSRALLALAGAGTPAPAVAAAVLEGTVFATTVAATLRTVREQLLQGIGWPVLHAVARSGYTAHMALVVDALADHGAALLNWVAAHRPNAPPAAVVAACTEEELSIGSDAHAEACSLRAEVLRMQAALDGHSSAATIRSGVGLVRCKNTACLSMRTVPTNGVQMRAKDEPESISNVCLVCGTVSRLQ